MARKHSYTTRWDTIMDEAVVRLEEVLLRDTASHQGQFPTHVAERLKPESLQTPSTPPQAR